MIAPEQYVSMLHMPAPLQAVLSNNTPQLDGTYLSYENCKCFQKAQELATLER